MIRGRNESEQGMGWGLKENLKKGGGMKTINMEWVLGPKEDLNKG